MKRVLAIAVLAVVAGGACTSMKYNEASGARLSTFLDFRSLSRKDYNVKGSVKGEATVNRTIIVGFLQFYSFGFPGLSSHTKKGELSGFPGSLINTNPLDYAREMAIFAALQGVPDADLILQPRFSYECNSRNFIFYIADSCTVTVRGKAISINEG